MTLAESTVEDIPALISKVLELTPTKLFWFRGQGCAKRDLAPSIWRKLKPSEGQSVVQPRQVLEVETRLLTRFRQRSLPYWPAGYPQSDWEHLFAMQHYGLPTRLLDWTGNLLMAVYFSVDHDIAKCECGTGACQPTVWVLDPISLNNANPRLQGMNVGVLATSDKHLDHWSPGVADNLFAPAPVAIYGTYNSDRIAAQSGSFTVAGKEMSPLNQIPEAESSLTKITLTGDRKVIQNQLKLMGITQSAVYPGLAELAQDIANEEID